jgi:two-component system sensor histidine kinase VicK
MGNAIKFSHAGSEINIEAKKTNSNLIIIVKDKGIGIPPENINAIFERFTKVKNFGTKGEKPVGLGLSIVKQIVEKHNGTISVKSEAGAGTEFFISIP